MGQIIQAGSINTTALTVPDLYIQIEPPPALNLNGVPSNKLGIVGTATWGPVNSAVTAGLPAQGSAVFGPLQNRANDLITAMTVASQLGANNFALVRVTDGTDVAATIVVQTNCITFTAKYTGSFGNSIQSSVAPGSQSGTFKVSVAAPGLVAEVFDNIGSGLTGAALWAAIASAINNGTTVFRGPSNMIVASAGSGTTAPVTATYTLASGTDGVTTITASTLLGVDTAPRTGMYALRNNSCSVAMLADITTSSSWPTQVTFGLSEGIEMVSATASGDTISNAATELSSAGVDSYAMTVLFGDWIYWLDTYNNVTRLLSPQAFKAGMLVALSPQNSPLNKQMSNIVGTQKSYANQTYAEADIQALVAARLDVIANPSVGGPYFSCRIGHNTSSNPIIHSDAYTRMTNYIAGTLDAGMGQFVGDVENPNLLSDVQATLSDFFQTLWNQGLIGNAQGTVPYSVGCDPNDNPLTRTALGYLQADVSVQYLPIAEEFLINMTGGTSVQITRTNTALA
jgi:hypothetical protein